MKVKGDGRFSREDIVALRLLHQARGEPVLQAVNGSTDASNPSDRPEAASLQELWHWHKKCRCYKSDYRDPDCAAKHPDICPWRAMDLAMLCGAAER